MEGGDGHQLSRRGFLLGSAAAILAAKVAPIAQAVEVVTQGDLIAALPSNYPIGTVLSFVFNTGKYPQVFIEAWGSGIAPENRRKQLGGGGGGKSSYATATIRNIEAGKWKVIK